MARRGPRGGPPYHTKLPEPVVRWTDVRKAEVLARIDHGDITAAEALRRFAISPEELEAWRRDLVRGGAKALRATYLRR